MNTWIATANIQHAARPNTRHDGVPWARLVLSLLLLSAPTLALGLESAREAAFLAGAFNQLESGVRDSNPHHHENPDPVAQAVEAEAYWRHSLRELATETLTLTRVRSWVQPAAYSHGRIVDPALYLQRTLR